MQTAGDAFIRLNALQVVACGLALFGGIYLLFGGVTWLLTQRILPALHIGRVLDPRPIKAGQVRRELGLSAMAIGIFGVGMLVPWVFLQLGWARLYPHASVVRITLEIAALIVWNDIHFWLNHRLLHTRWLRRFHLVHHRSIVTTPWATFALHPIEAMMLGSVMLPPMLVHDFSFWSLLALPLSSLWGNCIGHCNYDFFPNASYRHCLAHSRQHHLHHACFHGNYGFQFSFMDRLFGTQLDEHAAHAQLQRYLKTHSLSNVTYEKHS